VNTKNTFAIQDVARLAGVSVSTVSRVLNHKPDVAEGTRQRVQAVIAQLNYAPYVQTAQRIARQTLSITVHYPIYNSRVIISHADSSGFFGGIGQAAREEQFTLNTLTTTLRAEELLALCREQQADGVILMDITQQDRRVELLKEHNIPFVMIGQQADNTGLSLVNADQPAYMRRAFEYLFSLGHRHIALLSYPEKKYREAFTPAVQSLQTYITLCQQYQIPAVYRGVGFDPHDAHRTAYDMLIENPQITAVIAAFSAGASGCMRALYQLGRRVPQDVSVVATLATRHEAELLTPALTALDFPSYEMGYRAAQMLIDRLRGVSETAEQVLFAPQFILRGSAGPPGGSST